MIRVNLLSERKQKKGKKLAASLTPDIGGSQKLSPFATKLIMVVVGSVIVMGLLVLFLQWRVSSLESEMKTNETTIADLQKKIEAVKQFEALNREIAKKNNLIETLQKSQSIPVQLLDDLTKLLPEGVWLTALNYSNQRVTLEGAGFTNIDIVTLVENLKKTAKYADVYLEETKRVEVEKVEVYMFKLNFTVKI
jgi:type IV pilus assembly protein PilN